MVRFAKEMLMLRIDGSQFRILKTIGTMGPIHLYGVHKETKLEEDLVYKSAKKLEDRFIEKVQAEDAGRISYRVTDIGAVALFGLFGIETKRLENVPIFGRVLKGIRSLETVEGPQTVLYNELRRFARRFVVLTPERVNYDISTRREFYKRIGQLLQYLTYFVEAERLGTEPQIAFPKGGEVNRIMKKTLSDFARSNR